MDATLSGFASMGLKALAPWSGAPSSRPFLAWGNGALKVHTF
jgi:hypothetical protein